MKKKTDVRQGTLALMVLKTLDVLGPLHGYGLARRKQLQSETRDRERTTELIGRFFDVKAEDLQ